MRTEQDKINRKEANQRYYKLEENKQQKRDYMKEYQKRDYVKARAHEHYMRKKIRDAKNEDLNTINSERFIIMKKKHGSSELEQIYSDVFGDAIQYMRDYEVQAVAATYMAIAMRLYKTHLDEDAYKDMIKVVMDTEIEPYENYLKKFLH